MMKSDEGIAVGRGRLAGGDRTTGNRRPEERGTHRVA